VISQSLVLLIGVWLLCLLLTVRFLVRLTAERDDAWRDPIPSIYSAEGRARAMLREMLSDEEFGQLAEHGYLEVPSPSRPQRVYRIPGLAGRVRVYDHGREVVELCLQPTEPLPDSDLVLMHKLMILANEGEYLAKANHFAPGTLSVTMRRI
jgi:hypothetical protein